MHGILSLLGLIALVIEGRIQLHFLMCICSLLLTLEDELCLILTVPSQFSTNLICGHLRKQDQGSLDRTSRASTSVTGFASVSLEMLSQIIFRDLSYLGFLNVPGSSVHVIGRQIHKKKSVIT